MLTMVQNYLLDDLVPGKVADPSLDDPDPDLIIEKNSFRIRSDHSMVNNTGLKKVRILRDLTLVFMGGG